MYLAGKDAAFFFARGQKLLEAFGDDQEYFCKMFSSCTWMDDKGNIFEGINDIGDLERMYDSNTFQFFLAANTYYSLINDYFLDYLSGGLYEAFIMSLGYCDEESSEWYEFFATQDEDERDLITNRLVTDFQDTEFVKINMMPTNEDLDKAAKWIYEGIKKSLFPYREANKFLNELSYRENELAAIEYECNKQIMSPYYVRLHNLEVKLKDLFLKASIPFHNCHEFEVYQNSKRFSVWEIPKTNGSISNGIYDCLAVENKDFFYKEIKKKLCGFSGFQLACAIYVLVNGKYLRKKPSTRILQAEFRDKTSKQYFDGCYRKISDDDPTTKKELEYWKEYFNSLQE